MRPLPLLLLLLARPCTGFSSRHRLCHPLVLEKCYDVLPYNSTTYTGGQFGPMDSENAAVQLETFQPLVARGCSKHLQFFLCATFAPMCDEVHHQVVRPCRPLCRHVRHQCQHILTEFGFKWPEMLECETYPERNELNSLCMNGEYSQEEDTPTTPKTTTHGVVTPPTDRGPCDTLRFPERYVYVNRTKRCAMRCDEVATYTRDEQRFVQTWQTLWACIALLCALLTGAAFALNTRLVTHPDRSLLFVSLCSGMQALGYLIRQGAGAARVSCGKQSGEQVLIQEGLENTPCAIVFLLFYYFGMASVLWWLVLCLGWFLAVAKRKRSEDLERYTSYMHLIAWALPAAQTIVILVMRSVDGDELTGTCYVGNQSKRALLGFVIAPLSVYMFLGSCLLVYTAVCLQRQRHSFQSSHSSKASHSSEGTCRTLFRRTDEQVRLQSANSVRPGLLALLYLCCLLPLLCCYVYEHSARDSWLAPGQARPRVELLYLRVLLALLVGVLATLAAHRTLATGWGRCYRRLQRKPQLKVVYTSAPSSVSSASRSGQYPTSLLPSLASDPRYAGRTPQRKHWKADDSLI